MDETRIDASDGIAMTCPVHGGNGVPEQAREPYDMHAPDSLSIRTAGDIRSWLVSGRTFLMQVAHPAVGAGVWELSSFRNDPWHRMRELNRSQRNFVFSGASASRAEGARLRALHRDIKGVDTRGRKYHSLQPHVYGWVHTVFLDSMIAMHQLYGTPLTRAQQEQLFVEWRQAGRMFGLKDRHMPDSLDGYFQYYEHMIATELEYTSAVDYLLSHGAPPRPPRLARMPGWAWAQLWKPLGLASRTLTLGALPPSFRAKIGQHQPWTEADERAHERFRALVRTVVPRLPERFRIQRAARAAMRPV